MFSQEINGYNRAEVDSYIKRMKASYEAKLMEEKLKALESEKRILDMKNEKSELESKEKNILNALSMFEKAKKFQEEGSNNFNTLIMNKLELLVRELNIRFPSIMRDQNFEEIMNEFSSMIENYRTTFEKMNNITQPIFSNNDSMRLLLSKMQDHRKQEAPMHEVHIQTTRKTLKDVPVSESGFSFEEALNPTEDLAEIMKAFDFYNDGL